MVLGEKMPRIDNNYYAIDISKIAKLEYNEMKEFINWVVYNEGFLITQPSIVIIDLNKKIRYTLGIGSVVVNSEVVDSEPPIQYYKIAGSEWIDACKINRNKKKVIYVDQEYIIKKGIAISLESKGIFLLLNGMNGEVKVSNKEEKYGIQLIILKDLNNRYNLLSLDKDAYYVYTDYYGLGKIVHYVAEIYSYCSE